MLRKANRVVEVVSFCNEKLNEASQLAEAVS
jgi:hypothetical protein